jgi:putative ABC transport system permease protein
VKSAGAAPTLPLAGGLNSYGFSIEGRAPQPGDHLSAEHDAVTPGYFQTLGIRLLQGRAFTERDRADSPAVVMINQTAARRFFPNDNPLGKRITIAGPEPGEVIGVVGDVKQYALASAAPPHVYSPQTQKPAPSMTVFVRTPMQPASLIAAVRQAVFSLDKDQPISSLETLDQVAAESLAQRRLTTLLLGLFAASALLLAAVGIFGVMACTVAQRSREIGLRLALGAQMGQVLLLVLGQGLKLVSLGLVLGLASSLALTRLLSSLLFGVPPGDPLVFAAVSALLAVVALVACWLPARRAARVDPLVALR